MYVPAPFTMTAGSSSAALAQKCRPGAHPLSVSAGRTALRAWTRSPRRTSSEPGQNGRSRFGLSITSTIGSYDRDRTLTLTALTSRGIIPGNLSVASLCLPQKQVATFSSPKFILQKEDPMKSDLRSNLGLMVLVCLTAWAAVAQQSATGPRPLLPVMTIAGPVSSGGALAACKRKYPFCYHPTGYESLKVGNWHFPCRDHRKPTSKRRTLAIRISLRGAAPLVRSGAAWYLVLRSGPSATSSMTSFLTNKPVGARLGLNLGDLEPC